MNKEIEETLSSLEEALGNNDDIIPEEKCLLEQAYKKALTISRNKKEDFIRLTPPSKEIEHYTEAEKQKIYEAAEKSDLFLFLKVLANPNKKVQRLIYPENKIIMMVSSIPDRLSELEVGTFLLVKTEEHWKLSLLIIENEIAELKEINITHIHGLEDALSKLPKNKIPEHHSENNIKNIARLIPLYPIGSYQDVSGETDFFQCLTSAQVTFLMAHWPHRVHILPSFSASIHDVWVSSVEADILLGKAKRVSINDSVKLLKIDRRKTDASHALCCLARFVWNDGRGMAWKAFIDMLDADHTKENPYGDMLIVLKFIPKGKISTSRLNQIRVLKILLVVKLR
jgi:hypothetical protein